jgi:hypothetical protein
MTKTEVKNCAELLARINVCPKTLDNGFVGYFDPKEHREERAFSFDYNLDGFVPVYTTPQPVVDVDAKREAESLAMALWQKWYKDDSPDFELCDSVAGVITQINNMTTGLVKEQDPQPVVPEMVHILSILNGNIWHTEASENLKLDKDFELRLYADAVLLSAGKETV